MAAIYGVAQSRTRLKQLRKTKKKGKLNQLTYRKESSVRGKGSAPGCVPKLLLGNADSAVNVRLEFPRETGLILRCAGKVRNPFQTKQGNRPSCRDQEGRRGSEEAVPGPSVFPSGEPGVLGDFWGSQEVAKSSSLMLFCFKICLFILGCSGSSLLSLGLL